MEELELLYKTYYEMQMEIAKRLIAVRKKRKISQKRLAIISGVPYASIRRFENTGDISFASFIKIVMALRLYDDLDNLFKAKEEYSSIEEVINDLKNRRL